ncbi:Multiple PDZ domain protein [Anopheles sinensis]|uniref:Multiple PDZ domain protein n=1 Tax=Anopheles sinensis TaxID=74873 RepID=A0A084VDK4_ANOSI|nr:Multiple PDZ domain protein [Anopheles sinensis]
MVGEFLIIAGHGVTTGGQQGAARLKRPPAPRLGTFCRGGHAKPKPAPLTNFKTRTEPGKKANPTKRHARCSSAKSKTCQILPARMTRMSDGG